MCKQKLGDVLSDTLNCRRDCTEQNRDYHLWIKERKERKERRTVRQKRKKIRRTKDRRKRKKQEERK